MILGKYISNLYMPLNLYTIEILLSLILFSSMNKPSSLSCYSSWKIVKWFRKIETNTYIFLNFRVQLKRSLGTKYRLMSLLIINKKTIPPSYARKHELLRYVVRYDYFIQIF